MTAYYQDYEYIRNKYGVPAKKGQRVRAYGKLGTITRSFGHYIGIMIDGEKKVGQYQRFVRLAIGER